jgi:hypothetical protein
VVPKDYYLDQIRTLAMLLLHIMLRYQSKTICENKNVSYEAHLCPIIVKAQRAPNAQATLQIVDRHYEEFLSPASLTLKPLRRPSNRSSPRQHFIRLCSHIVHVVYRRTWYVCRVEKKTDN